MPRKQVEVGCAEAEKKYLMVLLFGSGSRIADYKGYYSVAIVGGHTLRGVGEKGGGGGSDTSGLSL